MQRKNLIFLSIIAFVVGFFIPNESISQASDITFEKVKEKCKGLNREDRIRIRVTRFSVTSKAAQATGQFGEELTSIMTNAIQQTNCFRVLENLKNKEDFNSEMGLNESGATDGSGPQRGKMTTAQAIITAEITEYSEGKSSVNAVGFSLGGNKAKLGLIIKVLDPQGGEVLWSKSVNGEAKKSGLNGLSVFGLQVAGKSNLSEAMSAAVEDVVLRTVDILVKEKEDIENVLGDPSEGTGQPKQWNATNCGMLANGNSPKVMVMISEKHVNYPLPISSGESEILRKFLEAGFRVVDPSMYATLRNGAKFSEAVKNPMAAISLGKEFGADIVVFGEGLSQFVSKEASTVTCRARIDVKAARTDNAELVAANGAQAGGQDIAETTSASTAFKNAGAQVGDYVLGQFCGKPLNFEGGNNAKSAGNTTIMTVSNVNFTKANALNSKLKTNAKIKSLTKDFKGTTATFTIIHDGSTDDIAEMIANTMGAEYEITEAANGKIAMTGK